MVVADAKPNSTRWQSMDGVWQDVKPAFRTMRQAPAFTATIVLTLALGVGANAAIFGVINSLLLRPLAVTDPHRLVTIASDSAVAHGYPSGFGWSFAMWDALQQHVGLFGGALAWTPARFDLASAGERRPVEGIFVNGDYFATLGVPALRGRGFTPADDRPGGGADGPPAVISARLWQRLFGGSETVVGAPLVIDGVTVTIVGVTPPGFSGVDVGRAFDVALPLATEPLIHRGRTRLRASPLVVMLRLKKDQSVQSATAAIRGLQPQILGVSPEGLSTLRPAQYREPFTLVPAATGTSLPFRGPMGLRQSYTRPLYTILAVALLVLLIACVNIANLLLARGMARAHELGVRLALGASRYRIVRQLMTESAILAGLGALGGLIIARWIGHALVAQLSTPADLISLSLSFDWRLIVFTATVALTTAVVFGTVPALRMTRIDVMDVLRVRSRGLSSHTGGTGRLATWPGALVIIQVALSVALVAAAGLLVRSFVKLSSVPLGFDPERVLIVNVDTDRSRTDFSNRTNLYQRIVDAVAHVPGVAHAGGSIWTPVDGGTRLGDSQTRVEFNFVTPGWFAAYGTMLRAGRDFTATDSSEASPVAIVNEAFVRTQMSDRSPVGETITYFRSRSGGLRTIVGVVDDTVFESQREGIQPIVYAPIAQVTENWQGATTEISIGVRPAVGTPIQLARSVAAAIAEVDPNLSFSFRLLTEHVQGSVRQERVVAMLSGLFGALALALAALGLYGVTSYTMSRRVTEIGIRRALGAQYANVVWLVLSRSLLLTTIGIAVGLAGAATATRALTEMLFGLTPLDPATFIGVAAVFAIVAIVATLIPAHRAAGVDPLVALRAE